MNHNYWQFSSYGCTFSYIIYKRKYPKHFGQACNCKSPMFILRRSNSQCKIFSQLHDKFCNWHSGYSKPYWVLASHLLALSYFIVGLIRHLSYTYLCFYSLVHFPFRIERICIRMAKKLQYNGNKFLNWKASSSGSRTQITI